MLSVLYVISEPRNQTSVRLPYLLIGQYPEQHSMHTASAILRYPIQSILPTYPHPASSTLHHTGTILQIKRDSEAS